MTLRYFNIVFDEYYDVINDLEKVLCFTPVLTDLAVRCTHSLSPIDFFRLFHMLTERTPHLKCFQCRLNILVRKNEMIPEVNHIRQISSLFATIHSRLHERFDRIRIVATESMIG
ncbi:hypothetical protein I4U23_022052 [Adineta vaga]|nr:hypothetical protein I4U23_022052 [Adineta vaga]